jgi:hypothetical protein
MVTASPSCSPISLHILRLEINGEIEVTTCRGATEACNMGKMGVVEIEICWSPKKEANRTSYCRQTIQRVAEESFEADHRNYQWLISTFSLVLFRAHFLTPLFRIIRIHALDPLHSRELANSEP